MQLKFTLEVDLRYFGHLVMRYIGLLLDILDVEPLYLLGVLEDFITPENALSA